MDEVTANQHAILEQVVVTVNGIRTVNGSVGLGAEVVLITLLSLPAGNEVTGDHEVEVAACLHDTVGVQSLAASADELVADDLVGVAGSGNGGTEVCDGLTGLAVGTAGVAVLGTGGSLVLNCHGDRHVGSACGVVLMSLDTVVVTAVPIGVPRLVTDVVHTGGTGGGVRVTAQLGIDLNGGACEGSGGAVSEGNDTAVDLHVDIHGQDLVALLVVGIHPDLTDVTGDSHDGIQLPGTDRDGNQSGLAGQLHVTGLGNGHGSDLLVLNQGVGCGEALGHIHVIQMPSGDVVQVKGHGDGGHVLDGSCNHVDVVQGAEEDAISIGIMSDDLYGSVVNRVDHDLADDGGVVAHLIADGKLHDVATINQLHVVQSHLGVTAPNQLIGVVHVVDVDLTGSGVDTGVVGLGHVLSHGSGEADGVGGNGLTVQGETLVHTGSQEHHVAELRRLAVINCRGVVDGDVINVEGVITVDVVVLTVNVAVLAVLLADVELQEGVVGTEAGVLEGADINGDVVPAGLLHSVHEANLGLLSGADSDAGVTAGGGACVGTVGVHAVQGRIDTQTNSLVGNVDPHTDGLRVGKDLGLAEVQATQREAGLQGIGEIDLNAHGVLTVADVAVVGVGQEGLAAHADVVVVGSGAAEEAMEIGVLEVVNDFGALTQSQLTGSGHGLVQNQSGGQDGGGICQLGGNGGEGQTVEGTQSGIGHGQLHVVGLHNDLIGIVVSGHTDLNRLAVRNNVGGRVELDGGRNHDLEVNGTHLNALVVSGHGGDTSGAVGGEHAIGEGAVDSREGQALGGQGSGCTGGINALDGHGNGGTGGDHIIGSGHGHMVELTGSLRIGHHDDTVDGGTGSTVGGDVTERVVRLTLALGQELGGSAAVTVDSPDTAQSQHGLAQLVGGQTNSVGGVTTLGLADNQSTVGLDTDHGTVGCIGTVHTGSDQLTVLDDEAEVAGHSLPLVAMKSLGAVTKLELDRTVILLGDGQIGLRVAVESGGCENLTVPHHEATGSLVVVCQSSVHTADDVVAQLVTVVVHLLLHDLSRPIGGIGQILVDGIVGRQNADVGVVGVNLNHVQDLSASTVIVVDNDLRLDRAVTKYIVILGDYVVVIAGLGLFIGCGQHADRNQREHHDHAQNECNDLSKDSFLHLFLSFFYLKVSLGTPHATNNEGLSQAMATTIRASRTRATVQEAARHRQSLGDRHFMLAARRAPRNTLLSPHENVEIIMNDVGGSRYTEYPDPSRCSSDALPSCPREDRHANPRISESGTHRHFRER